MSWRNTSELGHDLDEHPLSSSAPRHSSDQIARNFLDSLQAYAVVGSLRGRALVVHGARPSPRESLDCIEVRHDRRCGNDGLGTSVQTVRAAVLNVVNAAILASAMLAFQRDTSSTECTSTFPNIEGQASHGVPRPVAGLQRAF
jgi:hypothetical protein